MKKIKQYWKKINFYDNLPIFFSIIVLLASFTFTFNDLRTKTITLEKDNQTALSDFNINVKNEVTKEFGIIKQLLIEDWLNVNNKSELFDYNRFLSVVPFYYNYSKDILAINWVDSSGVINWVYPFERNQDAINKSIVYLANGEFNDGFNYSKTTNETGFTHLIPFFQGGTGFASYIPIIYDNSITGYINVVFELHNIIQNIISNEHSLARYSFIITERNTTIPSTQENFTFNESFVIFQNISIFTMNWVVFSRPISSEIEQTTISSVLFTLIFEVMFCIIIYIVTDLLKRKNIIIRRELEDKEKIMNNLLQDEKLKSLGTLAGGITHDFNNILTNITGHVNLLDEEIKTSSKNEISKKKAESLSYGLSAISKNLTRSKNLIDQILVFSRNKILNFEILNLQEVILETINLVKETSDNRIKFTTELDNDLFLYADQTQFVQIIMNLLINSINAVDLNNAQIIIKTSRDTEKFNEYLLKTLKSKHTNGKIKFYDKGCIIKIRDNGKGMNQEQIQDAFDPFSLIKHSGKGSGLGLGIVHNNVTSLGGLVSITSEVGSYTEVEIKLPLVHPLKVSQGDEQEIKTINEEIFEFKDLTIMLIDDEQDIVDSYGKILKKLGAKVISATDGSQAWSIYQKIEQAIDLIILDIKMPGINGIDLVKLIKKKNPDQKVIFMTGFTDEIIEKEDISILQKPFQISDLIKLIEGLQDN